MDSLFLKDICDLIVDCEHKTAPVQQNGYPSIRTPNIGRGRLILDNVNRVSEETYRLWTSRAIPQKDDLILAREAPLGNVAIVPANLKVCLGQRTVLIRPDPKKVEPKYLVYRLLGEDIQHHFHALSGGVTVPHLNMVDIRNLPLPYLPPLLIQRKIASILSAYDDLIENNTRRIRILEEMAQAIYREWFVKFRFPGYENVRMVESELRLVPEGWEKVKLGEVADLQWGDTTVTKASYVEEGFDAYSASGLDGKLSYYDFNRDGVVLSAIGANCGLTWFVNGKWSCIKNTIRFWSTSEFVSTEYLYYFTKNPNEWPKRGSAQPFISQTDARNVEITIPPIDLLKRFTEIANNKLRLINTIGKVNKVLESTRDLLVTKLVGEEITIK